MSDAGGDNKTESGTKSMKSAKSPSSPESSAQPKLAILQSPESESLVGSQKSPVLSYHPLEQGLDAFPLPDYSRASAADVERKDGSSTSVRITDSFEWLNNDEEEIMAEEPSPSAEAPISEPKDELQTLLPPWIWQYTYWCAITLVAIPTALGLIGIPFFKVADVPLHLWARVLLACGLAPKLTSMAMRTIIRSMRRSVIFSTNELPVYIDSAGKPLCVLFSLLMVASVWFSAIPLTCSPGSVIPNAASFRLGSQKEPLTIPMGIPINPLATDAEEKPRLKSAVTIFDICYLAFAPKFFVSLIILSLLWLIQVLGMEKVRSAFLARAFRTRLIESRFKCYVVDQLKSAADRIRQRDEADQVPSLPLRNVDAEPAHYSMPVRENEPLVQPSARPRDYSIFRRNLIQKFNTIGYESAATTPPKTDIEAKSLARDIFRSLCSAVRSVLLIGDFREIFKSESATRDAYYIFDRDRDGEITKKEFRTSVVAIFKEQRNLNASIADAGQALCKLAVIFGLCMSILGAFIVLAIFDIRVQNLLTLGLSVIIGINFIIGESAKNAFSSLVFLFVQHPYDVGDKVVLGQLCSVEHLTVVQINVLTTVFHRWNGQEVYMSNVALANSTMVNLSRSTEQWERVDFELAAPPSSAILSLEDNHEDIIAQLRDQITLFLRHYNADYYAAFDLKAIVAADFGRNETSLDTICFTLRVQCRPTVDSQRKWARHTRLLAFIRSIVKRLGLQFAHEILPQTFN